MPGTGRKPVDHPEGEADLPQEIRVYPCASVVYDFFARFQLLRLGSAPLGRQHVFIRWFVNRGANRQQAEQRNKVRRQALF